MSLISFSNELELICARVLLLFLYSKMVLILILFNINHLFGGARGVMVIVAGYRHGDTSSNPGPDWLHFTYTNNLGKGMNPNILPPAMDK